MTAHFPGTGTSIKSGKVKLVLYAQTSLLSEIMRSDQCFPHVSNMPTITYNRVNRVIIKNGLILNSIHNIFNHCETKAAICISSIKDSIAPTIL